MANKFLRDPFVCVCVCVFTHLLQSSDQIFWEASSFNNLELQLGFEVGNRYVGRLWSSIPQEDVTNLGLKLLESSADWFRYPFGMEVA